MSISFASARVYNLIMLVILGAALLYFMQRAKAGKEYKLRRFAAIEQAVGRATEMGKPVHFCLGDSALLTGTNSPQTLAGLAVLGYVAELTAKYKSKLIVTVGGSGAIGQTIPVITEVVKSAYTREGRPEEFSPDMIRFIASEQMAFVAGVIGMFAREKPAANILIGPWAGSATFVLERGHREGAITISGTARMVQIPRFAVMTDYLLIGEEIFAAAASITKEPRMVGTLVAEEVGKYIAVAAMVVGVILRSVGLA